MARLERAMEESSEEVERLKSRGILARLLDR